MACYAYVDFFTSFLCVGARIEESDAPLIESGRLIRNAVTSRLHCLLHRPPPQKKTSVKDDDGCQGKLGTEVYDREKCFLRHSANLMEFRDLTAIRHAGHESVGE